MAFADLEATMPGVIDHETMHVDSLPTIWSPVQRELSPEEHAKELEDQATASLLWSGPVPEQILRILLDETAIERVEEPPAGFDPDAQGKWDENLLAFAFRRPIKLTREERTPEMLILEYNLEGAGYWRFQITRDTVTIGRA
jgi:hypothetical protein